MPEHLAVHLGDANGRVEVDRFSSGSIYLDAYDYSGIGGADTPCRGCVILTPEQARSIANSLLRAAIND